MVGRLGQGKRRWGTNLIGLATSTLTGKTTRCTRRSPPPACDHRPGSTTCLGPSSTTRPRRPARPSAAGCSTSPLGSSRPPPGCSSRGGSRTTSPCGSNTSCHPDPPTGPLPGHEDRQAPGSCPLGVNGSCAGTRLARCGWTDRCVLRGRTGEVGRLPESVGGVVGQAAQPSRMDTGRREWTSGGISSQLHRRRPSLGGVNCRHAGARRAHHAAASLGFPAG